ncbi:hypothetical protein EYF80_055427 [Liparis tanakae]|uniref:Uncharacterized protein n=1 Tax=Liparis tanakae TaxID=230148 RepID=A0A4Z2F0X0_9TELE|nr:hypothetical protein EYF80_055427 [Liparis tanakae]
MHHGMECIFANKVFGQSAHLMDQSNMAGQEIFLLGPACMKRLVNLHLGNKEFNSTTTKH